MADKKISALPAATSVAAADIAPIVQGGVTKQASISLIIGAGLLSGVGAPVANPGVTVAIYVDTNTGTLYTWYLGAWH